MFRSKDFIFMDVINQKGKKVGFIKDLLVDFSRGEVIGFVISPYNLLQRNTNVMKEHITYFNEKMIISNVTKGKYLNFSTLKRIDVVDKQGNVLGVVQELIFCAKHFSIKGIILSTGFLNSLLYGKRILLTRDLILGEESILYLGEPQKHQFRSMPRKLLPEGAQHEK